MKNLAAALLIFISTVFPAQKKYVLVVHGGAGTITPQMMTPGKEAAFREQLTAALKAGYAELRKGHSSVDAVAAAVVILEDSPLFNAGKGAVFTNSGKNELDASVMSGKDRSAGAVAGVQTIRNPVKAAVAVMQKSEHVMLTGAGAERFAAEQGLEIVKPEYFRTQERWDGLQRLKHKEGLKNPVKTTQTFREAYEIDQKFGTVGAVALDNGGNIAAATSTGGMTNKKYGRIGDAPIIGAGTYANSQVGISATGWGEFFIRATAARTLAAKMEYQGKDIESAAREVLDEIAGMGGHGGLIALDKDGNMTMPFSTAGMYRGAVTEHGEIEVWMFR